MYIVRFPLKNTLNYTIFVPKILAVLLDYSLRFGHVGVDEILDLVRLTSVRGLHSYNHAGHAKSIDAA